MQSQKSSKATESARGKQAKNVAPLRRGTPCTATGPAKTQKRSQSTESAGAGGKKKAKQNGVASAVTGADWCSDCWALAQDGCRGAHRLVDLATAREDVAAEMAKVQQRMNALTEAALSSAPVLVARVGSVNSTCWDINGGDVRITLANMMPLTAKDIQAVCKALEGLELEYDNDGGAPTASVNIDGLKAVIKKLPSYVKGQGIGRGEIWIDAEGYLTLGAVPNDAKLLGYVDEKDVNDLCAATCGEGSDCQYSRLWHDGIGEGTTLKNVRLAD